ncbi:hypothetical protein [Gallaecimonas pentaromativorans]|uniref:Uncharacterized protein n=1 Tax=Gallaecimonas pentaromativorans TaxID=584787 RepID=A0A3N1PL83_9GAMM|nr:hypothetical protein [Gallaecimonas pentaromativorans]ROQ28628.1 hypothetical protein EDC28_103221 [Gallaecimonas pentaromativorans]
MKAALTRTLILLSALLITALTFWGLMASVKLDKPRETKAIELALIEKSQTPEWQKPYALTCNCIDDSVWRLALTTAKEGLGCNTAHIAVANRKQAVPCHYYSHHFGLWHSAPVPLDIFRVGA